LCGSFAWVETQIWHSLVDQGGVGELVSILPLSDVKDWFKFGAHGFPLAEGNPWAGYVTFLTEQLKAAAVTTVVEISTHLYFVGGASRISALKSHASFVLMPV